MQQLDQQILTVLTADRPQSVRHVFYRMTDPRLPEPVEKSQRGYRHVQDRCGKLRLSGAMPYGWISDTARRGFHTPTYRGAGDFLRSVAGHYRADLWQHSDSYCEVWVESRSIAGAIQGLCQELAVSLYPAGGFTSHTQPYEAAEYINVVAADKRVQVFYIGDYDQAGVLVDVDIERKLRRHLSKPISERLTFTRLGITEEQVHILDLPRKPPKATDRRSPHIKWTVEAEAMPARLLRKLLREAIEGLLPEQALAVAKVAEASEREHLERMAALLGYRQ